MLFIPGNAGSYKQVRPIAAETANYFHHDLQHDDNVITAGVRNLDFFTVDFNEDITAFHGQTLLDQAEYLNEAVRYILSLYSDPQRVARESHIPDPTSVIILGHSMGGVVARTMLVQPNYQTNSINTIVTMSAPHARPPVTFDSQIVDIYDQINDYWRHAYAQKWANNNPLWHVTLISIAGGNLDTIVPSDYASLESLVPQTHGFTVFTTGIPNIWTSMDHQAILWCDQFRKVISKTLYEVIDVHRASQTKPRADRMRVFEKYLLTGLEPNAQKTLPLKEASTLLTLDDESNNIVPAGERLVIQNLGQEPRTKAHLLPIPPQGSPKSKRFTLLTNSRLDAEGENGQLEILLCSVAPLQPGSAGSLFTLNMDLSGDTTGSTRLACKNAASDVVLLPASTADTRLPFYLQNELEVPPFSYLQYKHDILGEHQFVAVVDKATVQAESFVLAEFSDQNDHARISDVPLLSLLSDGVSVDLPANRPIAVELRIPSLESALFAYMLDVVPSPCETAGGQLFAPLLRQYLERPYESRFFVNVQRVSVNLHGTAPYVPPPLEAPTPRPETGLTLELWTDPTCNAAVELRLRIDILGSLGKLFMRYRTVFAAFPLLIVTLVLRKQFRVYDQTGYFISFSESMDKSLRQSIPLLLLSLTLVSSSTSGMNLLRNILAWGRGTTTLPTEVDYHRSDLLVGTDDPFFFFLIPLIGVVCIGVCTIMHYLMLLLTLVLGTMYGLVCKIPTPSIVRDEPVNPSSSGSPAFIPSTPRRRMITTAVLLFLVSTFIPYQFAYLVACLVQLFTVVRALRIQTLAPSTSNSNYYHYAHSLLLLMLWVLPINLPILAVWIRNLAVHWLTPFSSHHNVLSIMPFILLVENLTTGRMVPRIGNWLRHITSILLFGTALSAAVYGVSHAYMLHYLVNIIAAWLVILHSTTGSWSLNSLGAMFEGSSEQVRDGTKGG